LTQSSQSLSASFAEWGKCLHGVHGVVAVERFGEGLVD